MRRILFQTLFFSFFFLICATSLFAQETKEDYYHLINGIDLESPGEPGSNQDPARLYTYGNNGIRIDGNAPTVLVSFKNLEGDDKTYYICGFRDQDKCETQGDEHKIKPKNGEIHFEACGDGPAALKGTQVDGFELDKSKRKYLGNYIKLKNGCNTEKDRFHEGETYVLGLYEDKEMKDEPIIVAKFYVAHSYPKVLMTTKDLSTKRDLLRVYLQGRRPWDGNENNYQVIVEGINTKYKKEHCFTVHGNKETGDDKNKNKIPDNFETVGINTQGWNAERGIVVPEHILTGTGWEITPLVPDAAQENKSVNDWGTGKNQDEFGLGVGMYLLKINERVSDNRPLGIGNQCEGGHSYIYITFEFGLEGGKSVIKILDVLYDPNEVDDRRADKILPEPNPPCAIGAYDKETKICSKFNTAFGLIELKPAAFLRKLFTLAISAASVIGFFMLLMAGYKLQTSQGDKQKVTEAREQIIAVITGIIFIVLSFAILEIIGVDILRIPGFAR